jgi:uncharacterized lipoprotein YajG
MKQTIALTFVASTLFLAGCCTQKWQYEMIKTSSVETLNTPSAQKLRYTAVGFTVLPDGNYLILVKHKPAE